MRHLMSPLDFSVEELEHLLDLATGCAVCLLTAAMGIYMIRRANREMKRTQEKENG